MIRIRMILADENSDLLSLAVAVPFKSHCSFLHPCVGVGSDGWRFGQEFPGNEMLVEMDDSKKSCVGKFNLCFTD